MSMISYDAARKRFVFRQFHIEGFVNTYVQEPTTDAKTIVFVTEAIENIPPGYRARETYTILSNDEFRERFEIAEPGREFELYSEAHLSESVNANGPGATERPPLRDSRLMWASALCPWNRCRVPHDGCHPSIGPCRRRQLRRR